MYCVFINVALDSTAKYANINNNNEDDLVYIQYTIVVKV